ncbi:MAG: TonB-dependent receptor plug domain-containing protein [Bacteroidales bacterium]
METHLRLYYRCYVGDLNTINPNDIENFTVLKDAQAAIYGTIGANGVIPDHD